MGSGQRLKTFFLLVGDIVALYAGLFLTLFFRYGSGFYEQFTDVHALPFTIIFIVWILIFYIAGLYDLRRLRNNLDFLKTLTLSLGVNAIAAIFIFYLVPIFGITPKTNLFIFILIFAIIEIYWRRLFNRVTESGEAPNKVVVVGNGPLAEEVKKSIRQNPQLGYTIEAEVSEENANASPEELERIVTQHNANLIVVPRHLKRESRLVGVLYKLFGKGVVVTELTNFYEALMRKVPLTDMEEAWFLENIESAAKFYDQFKRAFEFFLAVILGIILLPVEILLAILVKLTSRGPVIYKHLRVGQNGHEFMFYKFRNMRVDAEKNGAQWATPNDDRVTPVGNFLRKSHLDELPQLWNIIKGDMSFVGPRPERPEFVAKLKTQIPFYEVRLLTKPGVSGWAQLHHRADLGLEDVKEKLQYDIYYLKNRSFILDLAIVLKTLKSFIINPK